MKKITIGILVLITVAGLTGCGMSKTSSKRMVAIRLRDAKGSANYTHVSNFGPEETPTVFVQQYGGNTLTIRLYRLSTNKELESRTSYVPYGKDVCWSFPFLAAGKYKAILEEEDGTVRESCIFSVYN